MPGLRLVDVLGEVFRTYGFDTTQPASPEGMSRTQYEVDMLVEKNGMDVLVAVSPEPGPVGMETIDRHARMVHDVGAYYGLIVSPHGFTDSAHHHAVRTKTILWDRAAIESAIGAAVLHEVLGSAHDPAIGEVLGITARAQTTDPPQVQPATGPIVVASTPTPAAHDDPMGFLFGDVEDAPTVEAEAPMTATAATVPREDAWETPASVLAPTPRSSGPEHGRGWILETRKPGLPVAPDRPTGLASLAALGGTRRHGRTDGPDPRVFNPTDGVLVAPTISKEAAAKRAREEVFTIDHTYLRYHPKRVLDWSVEAFVEGQVTTTTFTGCRVVDLATRQVEAMKEWTAPRSLREGTFDVAVDHKPVRIEAEKACELAMESILEETARQVTVQDFDRALDIMITEKRRVRAHRDDVKIDDRGLHWCPVWCFVGVNGEVEVDGLTGQVLEKRLETPAGNTILI